jgi:hypothetical protein
VWLFRTPALSAGTGASGRRRLGAEAAASPSTAS